jgi:hypothetical protein
MNNYSLKESNQIFGNMSNQMSELVLEDLCVVCLKTLESTKNYFQTLFSLNKYRKPKFEKAQIEIIFFSSIFKKLFQLTKSKYFENVEHVEENLKFFLTNVYKDTSLEYSQRFFFLLDMIGITFRSFLQNLEKIDFDVEKAKDIISILKQREKQKISPNLLIEQEDIESCEHVKEISFCVDCQKSLCDKCIETHQSEHEIFPLTELKEISNSLKVDYPFPKNFVSKSENPLLLLFDGKKFIREEVKNELK